MSFSYRYIAILVLLVKFNDGIAQTITWKKEATRLIWTDTSRHKQKPGTTFVEMLMKAEQKGEITAYKNIDAFFSFPYTADEFDRHFIRTIDTITVVDPVTGKETIRISEREFRPDFIERYKLREQWQFTPATGLTTIHIIGLAPAADIYNEDGSMRAISPVFWIKYKDAVPMLRQDMSLHPKKNMATAIWQDYAQPDSITGSFKRNRTLLLTISEDDTVQRHLRDITPDTTYIERLRDLIRINNITAYKDNLLTIPLTPEDIKALFDPKLDTITTIDPEVGKEVVKVMKQQFNYEYYRQLLLNESLRFDPLKGEMITQIISLAPAYMDWDLKTHGYVTQPMFWVAYKDFINILSAYEVYHPANTFAERYWNAYFQQPEYVH